MNRWAKKTFDHFWMIKNALGLLKDSVSPRFEVQKIVNLFFSIPKKNFRNISFCCNKSKKSFIILNFFWLLNSGFFMLLIWNALGYIKTFTYPFKRTSGVNISEIVLGLAWESIKWKILFNFKLFDIYCYFINKDY